MTLERKIKTGKILFAVMMLVGGVFHFIIPTAYYVLIPEFLPQALVNALVGVLEIVIGLGLVFAQTRKRAAMGFLGLMLVFLPVHTWDVFRETPALGSTTNAVIRLFVQFLLIYGAWNFIQNLNKQATNERQ